MFAKTQLHLQVREYLLDMVRTGQLRPGDQLPSEEALSRTLGVSRNTVRDAFMTLDQDGFVVRRQGVGTFLTTAPVHLADTLNSMSTIPDVIEASGYEASITDVVFSSLPGPSEVHHILGVPEAEALPIVSLVCLADGRPAVCVAHHMVPEMGREGVPWAEFDGRLLSFAERILNVRIHQAVVRLYAVAATADVARQLDVAEGSPVLKMVHTVYTDEGRPVFYSVGYQDTNLVEPTVLRKRR